MKIKLLLLHGALGSRKQFQSIKPLLKDEFEVYDLNFEGHGGVNTDKEYSIRLFTENTVEFLDKNEIDRVNIFGYSMGGYVALNMALQYPGRVDKIVTLGTKFKWDKESAFQEIKMLDPEKIKEKVPDFAKKLEEEHFPLNWETVVRKTAEMMLGLSEGKSIPNNDFGQIYHEVLIGIGSMDKMVTREESETVSMLIPNGKVIKLDGFPHLIEKIDPEKSAEFINSSFR